jgi:hypothetical protein
MQETTETPNQPPDEDLQTQVATHSVDLAKKHRDGSSWFFWIAGLSVVNSIIVLAGSDWSFVVGLGITQFVDGFALVIAEQLGKQGFSIVSCVAFVIDIMIAGSFVVWGVLARRRYEWAYIVGMVLYALDGLIFLLVQDWLSIAFHCLALFYLFNGFKACGQLGKLDTLAAGVAASQPQSDQATGPAG